MRIAAVTSALALLFGASPAVAQAVKAVTPPGGGQAALDVRLTPKGLTAGVCARPPCDRSEPVHIKPEALLHAARGKVTAVPIGGGRHAIHVRIPVGDRSWETVVAASPGGGSPKVIFNDWTGFVRGQDGLRSGPIVEISEPLRDGTRRIVVGEQREDITLCGRRAALRPKMLVAKTLELRAARMHRLSVAERNGAARLRATPGEGPMPERPPLLRAVAASSAASGTNPAALTDGNLETTWAEGRGGSGRGEFAILQAAPEVGISAFEIVIRPPTSSPKNAVSPDEFYLATPKRLYQVALPEDVWEAPGVRYRVKLPEPVRTDCVALIAHSAQGEGKRIRVTFAEIAAESELAGLGLKELVAALGGGGPRSLAAGAVLRNLGAPAFGVVAGAFNGLDEGGRRVALDVVDHASCSISVPVYVRALLGPHDAQRIHAGHRLRRCGKESAEPLVAALRDASAKDVGVVAEMLAVVAPDTAVIEMVSKLAKGQRETRAALRVALARAASSNVAAQEIRRALDNDQLGAVQTIDLLRALGPRLPQFGAHAERAFARWAKPSASFRTRFLLLVPAAHLAKTSPAAKKFLSNALTSDESHFVRAGAASSLERPGAFRKELLAALGDRNVRVREAAVEALGTREGAFAWEQIAERLTADRWPLVRARSARSLGEMGPNPRIDQSLANALEDESAHVRLPVVLALGYRRSLEYAPLVRERLSDRDEALSVRANAARALGLMCDQASLGTLTDWAKKLAAGQASESAHAIGPGAVWALGQIGPPDLRQRLAPLLTKDAPIAARAAAGVALRAGGKRCRLQKAKMARHSSLSGGSSKDSMSNAVVLPKLRIRSTGI